MTSVRVIVQMPLPIYPNGGSGAWQIPHYNVTLILMKNGYLNPIIYEIVIRLVWCFVVLVALTPNG